MVDESLRDWVGINIFSGGSQPTAPSMGVKGSKKVVLRARRARWTTLGDGPSAWHRWHAKGKGHSS